jgi:hypothetical protein
MVYIVSKDKIIVNKASEEHERRATQPILRAIKERHTKRKINFSNTET